MCKLQIHCLFCRLHRRIYSCVFSEIIQKRHFMLIREKHFFGVPLVLNKFPVLIFIQKRGNIQAEKI